MDEVDFVDDVDKALCPRRPQLSTSSIKSVLMRPSDLKSPFTWETRQVAICDRVWYVPPRCQNADSYSFPGWVDEQTFCVERPVCVEYCSGNGAWIEAKAHQHPHLNWVAVELKFERVRKIWSKIKNGNLDNLLVLCGEGYEATRRYFTPESVEAVYVNFPDPWPKNKHAKNRIIQRRFIGEVHRILKPEGTITLVTDDEAYSKIMIGEMIKAGGFESLYPEPYYRLDYPGYGNSFFDDLWRQQGKQIRYHVFKKCRDHG